MDFTFTLDLRVFGTQPAAGPPSGRSPVAIALLALAHLLLLVLPAHAAAFGLRTGERSDCFKWHSKAWCALDAADMSHKLSDMRRQDVEKALEKTGVGVADLAFAGAMAGRLLPHTSTFGTRWTDVSMILLSALLERKPPVLEYNKAFGWMPYEMAPTADAAEELLANLIHQKTREALRQR